MEGTPWKIDWPTFSLALALVHVHVLGQLLPKSSESAIKWMATKAPARDLHISHHVAGFNACVQPFRSEFLSRPTRLNCLGVTAGAETPVF